MNKLIKSSAKCFITLFFMMRYFDASAGVHVTLSASNCVQTSLNCMTIDLYMVNDGDTSLNLNSLNYGLNVNSSILNGGKLSWTFIPGTSQLPSNITNTFSFGWSSVTKELKLTCSTSNSLANSPLLPFDTLVHIGTFSICDDSTWTPGSSTNFALQLGAGPGLTNSGIVAYVNGEAIESNINDSTDRSGFVTCSITLSSSCITPSLATASSNSPACDGSTLDLTSLVIAGTAPLTYAWIGPNNFSSSAQDTSLSAVTSAAGGTYTVTISNSCGSTTATASIVVSANTKSVTAQSACDSYTWSASGQTYTSSGAYEVVTGCHTDSLYLNIQTVSTPVVNVADSCGYSILSTTAGASLLWSTAATTSSISVTTPATYSVTRTFNGCSSQAGTGTADPGLTLPTVTISPDTAICYGNEIQLTASGGINYAWSPDSAISGNANSSTILANPKKTTTYSVVVTDVKGCTNSDTTSVTVYPPPNVRQSGDTLYVKTDPNYTGYQWYDSATLIPGATDTFYVVHHKGPYYVRVTSENGCVIAVEIYVLITGLLSSSDFILSGLTISPNPSGDWLMISGINAGNTATLTVFNMLGEVMQEGRIKSIGNEAIDIKTFPSGIYFLQLDNEHGRWNTRFVKR